MPWTSINTKRLMRLLKTTVTTGNWKKRNSTTFTTVFVVTYLGVWHHSNPNLELVPKRTLLTTSSWSVGKAAQRNYIIGTSVWRTLFQQAPHICANETTNWTIIGYIDKWTARLSLSTNVSRLTIGVLLRVLGPGEPQWGVDGYVAHGRTISFVNDPAMASNT